MIIDGASAPTSSACSLQHLRQVGCGVCPDSFAELVLHPFHESRVAVVSQRELAVLPSSSPPGENTVLTEHSLAVLSWSSLQGVTVILTEQELDWLQSRVHRLPLLRRDAHRCFGDKPTAGNVVRAKLCA